MEKRNEISLRELLTVGVSLVIIGLVFTFGTEITADVRSDYTPSCPNGSGGDYAGGDSFSWDVANQTCYNKTENALAGYNQTDLWNTSGPYLAANDSIRGLAEIPSKLPTIALIIAVAVIIAVLTRAFLKVR